MSTVMSDRGQLKLGIVRCLEDGTEEQDDITPIVDSCYIRRTRHYVRGEACSRQKFPEYAQDVFLPYVEHQLGKARIIDVVCDNYRPDYLKAQSESVARRSQLCSYEKMGRISQNQLEQPIAVRISEQRNYHNVN